MVSPWQGIRVEPSGKLRSYHGVNMFAIGFAMLFMVDLGGLAATAVAYRLYKSAAERNVWRTSETMLHVMALIGGWPGALVAQQAFRHKSRKLSFRLAFWTTVALNCAALTWLAWMARRYR